MTENPFGEAFGSGGFDLGAMLQQAQQLQEQMARAQEELAAAVVEGAAGGVQVTLTGTGELTGVSVPAGVFDGNDPDSLADLGDLVVAAFRDAKGKADAIAAAALGPVTGALGGGLGGDLTGGSPLV